MQSKGKTAQEIQQEEQKRALEIAEEIAQGRLSNTRLVAEQQNQANSKSPQEQINNPLWQSQALQSMTQSQPPMQQPQPHQHQQPVQYAAYPTGYILPYGQNPHYQEYLPYGYQHPPQQPQPPYDQYPQHQAPYGYQYPPVHQFQPAYGQYPHGHQPPYPPYYPDAVYQQQGKPQFHFPPKYNDGGQTNGFGSQPFHPEDSQVHPEHDISTYSDVESTVDNNPEENLEPIVTQFKNLKVQSELLIEPKLNKKDLKKAILGNYKTCKDYDAEKLKFCLQQLSGNQESASLMINVDMAVHFAYSKLNEFMDYIKLHFNKTQFKKYQKIGQDVCSLLGVSKYTFYDLINLTGNKIEQQRYIDFLYDTNMPKLLIKSSALWQLGITQENEASILFNAAKEAINNVFFEWELLKNSMLLEPGKSKLK